MAEEQKSSAQQAATAVTETSDFASLLNQEFRPKSDRALAMEKFETIFNLHPSSISLIEVSGQGFEFVRTGFAQRKLSCTPADS